MKVTVNSITGFEDTFAAMYISKRTWTPELDKEIRDTCNQVLDARGNIKDNADAKLVEKFNKWLGMALKMGRKHITILRFINISLMTEGMHRGGQDDIDAHAKRFDNRIIRSSTRLATFDQDEFSSFYSDKVMTLNAALKFLGINIPKTFEKDGVTYVSTPNGYVKQEYENNKDVRRGLYMLGIPSNFVSQINLTEWAHVFKERNQNGGANPEVKQWAEMVTEQITLMHHQITRDVVLSIEN